MVDLRRLLGRFGRPIDLPDQVREYRKMTPAVIADLAEFCGAIDPAPQDSDLFKQGRAAGRRDVWLRVQRHLCLSEKEIYAHLKGEPFAKPQEYYHNGMV